MVPQPDQYHVVTHPNLLTADQWSLMLGYAGFKVLRASPQDFNVACRCEASDTGDTPMGVQNHSERCLVIVARKENPGTGEVAEALNRLSREHEVKI